VETEVSIFCRTTAGKLSDLRLELQGLAGICLCFWLSLFNLLCAFCREDVKIHALLLFFSKKNATE